MSKLTPAEPQEARKRSGRLGGRLRKPTVEEARHAALDRLTPKALRVLEAHLGEGDEVNPDSWRAALRIFDHAFGRPGELADQSESPTFDVRSMAPEQGRAAIAEMLDKHPGLAALVPRTAGVQAAA
jgi:hypothetical protein